METNKISNAIYATLEDEIVRLKIRPGEVLSENTLCKRFHISRTPIRSVLQRLQQNGFVQILPHKGTIVTPICLHIASQWIYQRLAVECMVLRDFINICSPTDVAQIRYVHGLLREDAKKLEEDPADLDINHFLMVDLSMHKIWFKATDKLALWDNLTRPQADYSRFIRLDVMGGRNVPDVLEEHERLIQIIEEKELEALEPLLERHLYGGVRRMGGHLFSEDLQGYFVPEMPAGLP